MTSTVLCFLRSAATSSMRQEQDEEVRLQERMREQRHLLDLSEQRYQETQRRLSALKSSATGGTFSAKRSQGVSH